MNTYRLTHLDDATLLHDLSVLVARDRVTTAAMLAHIAEVDERRLYAAQGYASMFAYCVRELLFSEDATAKRIHAARAARRFPRLFAEVAAGRLHLTAVGLLAPHLAPDNLDELVAVAAGRPKLELEACLAERFGAGAGSASALRARVIAVRPQAPRGVSGEPAQAQVAATPIEHAPAHVGVTAPAQVAAHVGVTAPAQVASVEAAAPAPVRYVVRVPIDEGMHAKLRQAQALLAHAVPSGDLAQVLERALDALIERLGKRKGAAPVNTRRAPAKRPASQGRAIPARVRRAVWARDAGRCTFEIPDGRRCDADRLIEFDHVVPAARGGVSTVENLRLRCRAHNQLEAERAFGREFMRQKREESAASQGQSAGASP